MTPAHMIPATILSAHTMGLGVIRALGIMGVPLTVIYHNKSDMGCVSKYVKECILGPHPEEDEGQFLDVLIKSAEQKGKSLLVPADDPTLTVVSKHKELLSKYYIVACTEWNITEKYISKQYTYAIAEKIGVPTPKTILINKIDDIESSRARILYPCLVKPCYSHRYYEKFKIKMVKVETLDQTIKVFKQAAAAGTEVMLQEYIPGDDTKGVNYNSYVWNNTPLIEFTAEKVRLSPPCFGVPRVVKSKYIPEIIEPGRKILEAMNYYGYSCTEFKLDVRDGIYKLMEINGRHNRSTLLAVECGINFPWIEYKHLACGEKPKSSSYQEGVYWIDEISDIVQSIRYFRSEKYRMKSLIQPYMSKKVFSLYDSKDRKPFIRRIKNLMKTSLALGK